MKGIMLVAGIALLTTTAATAHSANATHDPRTGEYRQCFEDEAIVWSGNDDTHSHCIPVDDIPRMLWQECVAHSDYTDKQLHECDRKYGQHDMRDGR